MGKMMDPISEWKGEGTVWKKFEELLPDNIVIFNNRLIQGREFDFCLLLPNRGILIVEVKGWRAQDFQVLNADQIEVHGHAQPDGSPVKQARSYRFALLNDIQNEFRENPLVLDAVAFPFLNETDFKEKQLDKITDRKHVLLQEDFEDANLLLGRIWQLFATSRIRNTGFPDSLMNKIINKWQIVEEADGTQPGRTLPYSELHIFPGTENIQFTDTIRDHYLSGIKQIVFTDNKNYFDLIANECLSRLSQRGVQPDRLNLVYGSSNSFQQELSNSFRLFNMELYMVDSLAPVSKTILTITDGRTDEKTKEILELLSRSTDFNYVQYRLEHASPEVNIMVKAGAGTGKTYSLISRMAYLTLKPDSPVHSLRDEVGMITFTNDAADNLKKKLKQHYMNYFILTGDTSYLEKIEVVDQAQISTIHHFLLEILRKNPHILGLSPEFTLTNAQYSRQQVYDRYLNGFLDRKEAEEPGFVQKMSFPIFELKKSLMSLADKILTKNIAVEKLKPENLGTSQDGNIPYFNQLITEVLIPSEVEYESSLRKNNQQRLLSVIPLLEDYLKTHLDSLQNLGFKYLFVDEFQDTDDVQIQLFQHIIDAASSNGQNCRYFIVGDLKQSIYRFRGATLSAFDQAEHNHFRDPWEYFHLQKNYRTDSRLLEDFSGIFERLGCKGYIPYKADVDQLHSTIHYPGIYPRIEKIEFDKSRDGDFYRKLYDVILQSQQFDNFQREQTPLSKTEQTVAILVRSNRELASVVKNMKEMGLNVDSGIASNLYQSPACLDYYRLANALENGQNCALLTALLESRFVDLNYDYRNLAGLDPVSKLNQVTEILNEYFLKTMNTTWNQLLDELNMSPALFVVNEIFTYCKPWSRYGMTEEEKLEYIDNYEFLQEYLIQTFSKQIPSIGQIRNFLEINITTGQQKDARELTSGSGSFILARTIHKSKGLEYGTVILPFTDSYMDRSSRSKFDVHYRDRKLGYMASVNQRGNLGEIKEKNSFYDELTEITEGVQEEARILYVALTRAMRRCIWITEPAKARNECWSRYLEVEHGD